MLLAHRSSTRVPDLREASEILVIKPSSLGDIIHTLPAVAWLKASWPHLTVRWVVNSEWAPVLSGSPVVDEAIEFPRRQFRGVAGLFRGLRWMTSLGKVDRPRADVALDFQGLLRSAIMARASGAAFVAGLDDAREGAPLFYDAVAQTTAHSHSIERYLALVRRCGADESLVQAVIDGDWLPPGTAPTHRLPERYILIHPFARGHGKSLGWPEVVVLARHLATQKIVVVGMTAETPPPLPDNVVNLANATSLPELTAITRRAAAVVSVDSGPMHLASALHRPLIGIHTWSDPRKVGPFSQQALIWKGGRLLTRPEVTDAIAAETHFPSEDDLAAIARRISSAF